MPRPGQNGAPIRTVEEQLTDLQAEVVELRNFCKRLIDAGMQLEKDLEKQKIGKELYILPAGEFFGVKIG